MNGPQDQSTDAGSAFSQPYGSMPGANQRCSNCDMALPAGARFCMNCGQPTAGESDSDEARRRQIASPAPSPLVEKVQKSAYLSGERRQVTAVFIDVVSSTALSQQLGAPAWSTVLNQMCDAFCPVLYRYEGTIARFVGDELLAFFGAPLAHEDDPLRAVHAALEILEIAGQIAQSVRSEFGIEFAIRISLSSGPVTLGPVSSDLYFEYSALEGTLNLVTQLEATKRSMAVLVSEETYRLIAPFFDCLDLGPIPGSVQGDTTHIYQVRGARQDAGHVRRLAGPESPLVGRAAELQTLLHLTDALVTGLGRTVLIVGESGIGKTRLVHEWKSTVTQDEQQVALRWAAGHCPSYGQGRTYHLLRDLLRSLAGLSIAASEPETRAGIRSLTDDLFGDAALDVYPYLGHLLALQLEPRAIERIKPLDPPALQAQYVAACKRLLLALAGCGPLVLLLEDLQWADHSSITVLSQLLPLAANLPILFCLVTRPHRSTPGWNLVSTSRENMGGRFTELRLHTLSEQESLKVISNLQVEPLPRYLQQLILEKAEGNPLFIEEVLRMLATQNSDGKPLVAWPLASDLSTMGIPDTLQGLMMARLDRLSEQTRQILRVAAVIGRQFSIRVLEQVLGEDHNAASLLTHLGDLESGGLIDVYQIKPELTYRFHNTLLHEAVYASLLPSDRQHFHLAVGTSVESLYPDRLEQNATQLGRHFLVAGQSSRAREYFFLAGDVALNASANEEAEERYRQALHLNPPALERAALASQLGQALYWQSRFQEALRVWREGIELYLSLQDSDGLSRLYARSARAIWNMGNTPASLQMCQEGLQRVTGASESSGLALLLHEAARAYLFNGLPAEARRLGNQALQMAQRLGDMVVQTEALATLGLLPDQPPEAALAALSKAADLAESADLLGQAARAHMNLAALMATSQIDLVAACDHYRRAAELHHLRGNTAGQLLGLGGMVGALLDAGEFAEVEATLPVMRQLLDELANTGPEAFHVRISEALLRRYCGDLRDAARLLRSIQVEERQRGNLQNMVDAGEDLAELLLASHFLPDLTGIGEWPDAESVLAEAIEIRDRWGTRGVRPRCLLSMVYTGQGMYPDARRLLADARQKASSPLPAIDDAWLSLADARLAAAEARWPQALALFTTTAGLFNRLGMRWQHARILLEWADVYQSRAEPPDIEQARNLLQESQALFAAMGTTFYADFARDRLRLLDLKSYTQALAHQKIDQELAAAGKIQTGFLPSEPPHLPGWQLAIALEPSRQTSGDFYDFIPLPDSRLGIVIADVADKGAAAALFMALSSTLIRTYALEHIDQPALVLQETNRRILADTHTGLFVTVFYAVLDPLSGTLLYSSAGHSPPFYVPGTGESWRPLSRTGMPVGILEDATWTTEMLRFDPGDLLVLYTDGATDAQDQAGSLFSAQRLLDTIQTNQDRSAAEIQTSLLSAIHRFVGNTPQFDDIALIVLKRDRA